MHKYDNYYVIGHSLCFSVVGREQDPRKIKCLKMPINRCFVTIDTKMCD